MKFPCAVMLFLAALSSPAWAEDVKSPCPKNSSANYDAYGHLYCAPTQRTTIIDGSGHITYGNGLGALSGGTIQYDNGATGSAHGKRGSMSHLKSEKERKKEAADAEKIAALDAQSNDASWSAPNILRSDANSELRIDDPATMRADKNMFPPVNEMEDGSNIQ